MGELQKGARLADARLTSKAAETITDKATSWLAKLPTRDSSLSLLEEGGEGRQLALAGRWLGTRCVSVHELVSWGDRAAWGPMPASSDELWMARKRLLLLRSGGQAGRHGRRRGC